MFNMNILKEEGKGRAREILQAESIEGSRLSPYRVVPILLILIVDDGRDSITKRWLILQLDTDDIGGTRQARFLISTRTGFHDGEEQCGRGNIQVTRRCRRPTWCPQWREDICWASAERRRVPCGTIKILSPTITIAQQSIAQLPVQIRHQHGHTKPIFGTEEEIWGPKEQAQIRQDQGRIW